MDPSLLQQIIEANKSFLAGSPKYLDASGAHFVVIACIDARLTGLLEPALGLPRNRALVIRNAGNIISETGHDVIRSVATAVFLKGARDILVVGHTDCAMAKFSAPEVIDSFRASGVARSAFGDHDLRDWFGAFTDIKGNVLRGMRVLRQSSVMPKDVRIYGAVIGIESGELEVISEGGASSVELSSQGTSREVGETAPPLAAAEAAEPSPPAIPPGGTKMPVIIAEPVRRAEQATAKSAQPTSMLDAAMILRDFIIRERKNAQFEKTLREIETLVRNERDPVRIILELDRIAERYKTKYPSLPGALEYLKGSVHGRGSTGFGFKELMKRMME